MSKKDDCYRLFRKGKTAEQVADKLQCPIGTTKKYMIEFKKDMEMHRIKAAGLFTQGKTVEYVAEILGIPLEEAKEIKEMWCLPKNNTMMESKPKSADEIPFSDIGDKPTTEEIAKAIAQEVDMREIARQVKEEENKPKLKTKTFIEGEKANFLIDNGQVRIYIGEHFIKVPADYYALFIQEAIEVNRKMVDGGLA